MAPIRIEAADDPRIEPYRDIRERDLVGRQGRFVAEGEVVLRAAIRAGRRFESLLLAEKRVAGLATVIDALPPETPVYTADQAVLDSIAGFHLHRGVLGMGLRGAAPDPDALLAGLPAPALAVGLSAIANHDNMGGLFRNAAAFGVRAVVLDHACCDPLYRKAIRTSVGAALIVPFVRLEKGTDMVGLFARHGFETLSLSPAGAEALATLTPPARAAVLFGAEGPGLAPGLLARTRTVSIPMAGGFDSLNVATTAGIVLHHLAAGAKSAP